MKKIIPFILLSLLTFSCNDTKNADTNKSESIPKEQECTYKLVKKDIKFEWTAFKTSAKIPVSGTFQKIAFADKPDVISGNIADVMTNTIFKIKLSSVNSGNEERDAKLVDLFFGKLENNVSISGFVKTCQGDNKEGKVVVELNFNDKTDFVSMTYQVVDSLLVLNGPVDILNWKTEKALDSLHEACKDLHTGEDGVSKTWSEMDIKVLIPVKKECK